MALLVLGLSILPANGRVSISEFLAANATGAKDEDGETSDWIEIRNGYSDPVNLDGWFLTDDAANLGKWRFPALNLLPGQYLLIFASGKDRDKGELHTSFRLSQAGGYLALVRPDGLTLEHAYPNYPEQFADIAYGLGGLETEVTLIGPSSPLKFHDPQLGLPGTNWMHPHFDDASWLAGTNGIGYSSGNLDYSALLNTEVIHGEPSLFTRFRFVDGKDERLDAMRINYDDGFAAFLNGVLIASRNVPPNLDSSSRALTPHGGPLALQTETVDLSSLEYLFRAPLPDGVVASWDAVAVENQTLQDALGTHHGNLEGPVVVQDPNRGPVLDFDGTDLVVIPSHEAFNLLDFSVAIWVHVVAGQNVNDRLISRDNINQLPRMSFAIRTAWANGGRPMFQVGQNPPSFLSVAESAVPLGTGWHHLVGVREAGDSVRIYVDGFLQGEGPDYIEAAITNDAPITLGGYLYDSLREASFRGKIDEFRLYNRALSVEEIARAYASGGRRHYQTNAENVLAIQVLNHQPADDGQLLKTEVTSTLSELHTPNPPGYLVSTPYAANGPTTPNVADTPRLSHPDGVYGPSVTAFLFPPDAGTTVRYTLDGTPPTSTSPILSSSLLVNTPAQLRIRGFRDGWLPSPVVDYHYLDAPIQINEFLAINTSANPDNIDLDDFTDWVEIRNHSSFPVNLSGYSLTDDPLDSQKWHFPEGTIIWPYGYLLVWADDNDAAPGDLVHRDFSPYEVDRLQRIHASFKLSGDGESIVLFTPGGVPLDRVDYGPQLTDVSMGRALGSNDTWVYYSEPTAGGPNITPGVLSPIPSPEVQFSVPGGRYGTNLQLTLQVDDPEAVIRFTTDGSRPNRLSLIHTQAITIDQSTVVRAASFKPDHLKGPERVEVFLFDTNSTLPIVSLAAYPNYLYDGTVGIFSNRLKKREMPVHIDFYEADGSGEFHIDAGMRLIGFVILDSPQKTISINLDDRWGDETLQYPIFPNRDYDTFEGFILRPGGQDGDVSFLREGLINTVLEGQMDVDFQAYRPARLYLNGQYHGLYNIREKQDLAYLRANHPDVSGSDIDYIEHDVIPSVVLDGSKGDYEDLVDYMSTNDLAMAEHYDYVGARMDLNQFLNFQILSIYIGRHSPDHNIKFWKADPVGRWRWVVFDVDQMWSFPSFDVLSHVTAPVPQPRAPLWSTIELRSLLRNESFRNEFIHRFVTHMYTTFDPERVEGILDELKAVIDPEMPLQINRWPDRIPSLDTWEQNVTALRTFTHQRPVFQIGHLWNKFGLDQLSAVTVDFDDTQGQVQVHGVPVDPMYSEDYFDGIPVRLEAIPAIGFRFVGWTGTTNTTNTTQLTLDPVGGLNVTAQFEPDPDIQLLPNLITSELIISNQPSAWAATGDIHVAEGGRLVLGPGSTLLMPDKASLYVDGSLEMRGTAGNPVTIAPNPARGARHPRFEAQSPSMAGGRDARWGAIVLNQPDQPVILSHLTFSGSSHDWQNSANRSGITAHDADLRMDNLVIDNVRDCILTWGGSTTLRDSFIQMTATGDGINVKGAQFALVENCEFTGGMSFDTDAIDYDQLASGQILSNHIHGFLGFNSDGIDLGEGSTNILIQGNNIHDIADKGISVGQASSGTLLQNLIYNCEQGVGIKDTGSLAIIDRSTFFNNRYAVAVFEKNVGAGAGHAQVANSILSFSGEQAVFTDMLGTATVEYSLANTEMLPGTGNLFDDPEFFSPFLNDFRLKSISSAIDAGDPAAELDPDGSRADLGAIPYSVISNEVVTAQVVITEVHFNPSSLEGRDEDYEFVELYNPGNTTVALDGFSFVSGIQFTFPAGSVIQPGQYMIIAHNRLTYEGRGFPVLQWERGRLSNEGELLVLVDPNGYAVDMVQYGVIAPWPVTPNGGGPSLMVFDPNQPNTTAANWRAGSRIGGTPGQANWIWGGQVRLVPGTSLVEMSWGAVPGVMYQLEHRHALDNGAWTAVGAPVIATEDRVVFVDDAANPAYDPGRNHYFRVRVLFP